MNKRHLLKSLGITSIWSSPIISSVIIPAHAQATAQCLGDISFDEPGQFNFIVPACASQLSVEVVGASGGSVNSDRRDHPGGSGAVINDVISVNPGDELIIFVGQQAESTDGTHSTVGGFGHGRGGDGGTGGTGDALDGAGGGGSSAIVLDGQPIIIAGGGGGSGGASNSPIVAGGPAGFPGNFGIATDGGDPGANGVGGEGGINRNVPEPGENGGNNDGGDGLSTTTQRASGGGGGGGGFGGGGGGGRLGGGGGGGNFASSGASIVAGNIGNGRVIISYN